MDDSEIFEAARSIRPYLHILIPDEVVAGLVDRELAQHLIQAQSGKPNANVILGILHRHEPTRHCFWRAAAKRNRSNPRSRRCGRALWNKSKPRAPLWSGIRRVSNRLPRLTWHLNLAVSSMEFYRYAAPTAAHAMFRRVTR